VLSDESGIGIGIGIGTRAGRLERVESGEQANHVKTLFPL
jgi:hypothetical protein